MIDNCAERKHRHRIRNENATKSLPEETQHHIFFYRQLSQSKNRLIKPFLCFLFFCSMSYVPPHKRGDLHGPPSLPPPPASTFSSSLSSDKPQNTHTIRIPLSALTLRDEERRSEGSPSSSGAGVGNQGAGRTVRPIPSLASLCFETLAKSLPELCQAIEDEPDDVGGDLALPEDVLLALFELVRRKGMLTNRLLVRMLPRGAATMDISASGVTQRAFLRVLDRTPRLRTVDVRRCDRLTKARPRS